MPARLTASERIRIVILREMGMRVAQISRELNVHVSFTSNFISIFGVCLISLDDVTPGSGS